MMNEDEVRFLGISLLSRESDRDRQQVIGASDLANGCDRCLANRLLGRTIVNPRADSLWLGAEIGTSIHLRLQTEIDDELEQARERGRISARLAALQGGKAEEHIRIAYIEGYGWVLGTIDISLDDDVIDTKSSTRKKSCLMHDYLARVRGQEPPFGRSHDKVKLAQRDYDDEMAGMVHKMNSYFGQTSLYGLGREYAGRPVSRCHILWVNRDGNGIFDVPGGQRYNDPKAVHDVWPLSFDYSREEALRLVARGQEIWDRLQAGATPADFDAAQWCFPCSIEADTEKRELDIEATLGAAA